jgi:hypothetical protein
MALIVKDRVLESSTSTGTGSFTLTGAQTGYQSFSAIGNGNTTYYTIQGKNPDGTLTGEWEVGVGTWSTGNTLARNTVLSNSLGTTAKIVFSAGDKDVFVTYPSDKALLGTTSAVTSTGTGSVVLNSNPTFATDITVNGLKVGRGDGNVSTNTAFGVDAIGSPYITSANTNNVAVGYNALNQIGSGVATLTNLAGGSGYNDGTYNITLEWLSGTDIIPSGTFPTVTVTVSGGSVVSIDAITNAGVGFSDTTTVFYYTGGDLGAGSGFTCQIASLISATNNIALGYNSGNTNLAGSNSVYLGYGATGTGSNEIVIGANATGLGDNTVALGNTSTTSTTFRGTLNAAGNISFTGAAATTVNIGNNSTSGAINIGRVGNGGGTITIGQNTAGTTINIHTGVVTSGTKTLNLGSNSTGGSTVIGIGVATGSKTINIGTGSTTNASTITIGSIVAASATTVNGLLKQNTYTVANLPTGTAGSRSFVTNALSPVFGATVVGGGAVGVPVYHDGTSWKVG